MTSALTSRLVKLTVALVATVAFAAIATGAATAYEIEPGFDEFIVEPSNSQAGGHPDVYLSFHARNDEESCESECLYPRKYVFHWPEGFIGNPHVTPRCTLTEFVAQKCPADAQVGTFSVGLGAEFSLYVPVYNMETRPDQAGQLGFIAPAIGNPILIELSSRTNSDYGLDAATSELIRLPLESNIMKLWGVPQSPAHTFERFVTPLTGLGACIVLSPSEPGCPPGGSYGPTYAPSASPEAPFLQNPTECDVPLVFTGEVVYHGGLTEPASYPWPSTTGCNQASFNPSIIAKPTTTSADTASGLDSDLKVPQTQSPSTPAPSELKVARLTLPPGFSLNPGAADGKVACPDVLSGIGTLGPASCPEYSRIGTLELDVAALPGPIAGSLYLAEPKPGEPYRVLLTASGYGTHVKLLGTAQTNPVNGQVSIIFKKLPQAPLQEFNLHIFGSERGIFATPPHCGTYEVKGEFIPWNQTLATRFSRSFVTVSSGPEGTPCPGPARPFAPSVRAGVANNTAGLHSPFSLAVNRNDGEQNMTALKVVTPPGFAASLKGVPYCPESAIGLLNNPAYKGVSELTTPACPAASQIGTAVAGAGAGTHPLYTGGKVYLAGPYKGAPLSLVTVIPAVAGPYDLGNVAVRARISINPVTAQVTTESDPLPQILEGIPLRARSILINLNRPGFAVNPTDCRPLGVQETTAGDEGGVSTQLLHFQVANCSDLPYGPKLDLRLTGGLNRRGHPGVHATFKAQPGEANTQRVTVALPPGELLDNAHIGNVCTRPQFATNSCPPLSRLGYAEVTTPLLSAPLKGAAYLRSSSHNLPDIAVDLEGQFDVELVGRVDTTKKEALRTNFATAPDVPVETFRLNLAGGSKGLLVNSKTLCTKKARRARTTMVGQNGAKVKTRTKLRVSCGKKNARHRHHRASRKAVR